MSASCAAPPLLRPSPMNADVIIVGGGLIGSTLALALARHEVTSIVIDAQDLDTTTLPRSMARQRRRQCLGAMRTLGLGDVLDSEMAAQFAPFASPMALRRNSCISMPVKMVTRWAS